VPRSRALPKWYQSRYHPAVAMTLRLDDDDEARLERLATRWGVSKQRAILRAIREADTDVLAIAGEGAEKYAEALDRLGRL
jgi:predicted transcriptional regulator